MKKFLKSRWFAALLGGILFIATLVGLTLKSRNLLLQSAIEGSGVTDQAAAAAAEKKKAEDAKPKTMTETQVTPESKKHEAEKQERKREFERTFGNLNRITAAGDLQMPDPNMRQLIKSLQAQRKYLDQRESELEELEAHIKEQLRELHFHTNNITMTRAHVDKLLEGKLNQIKQNETTKLMELARVYEEVINSGDPAGREEKIRSLLRANQEGDPLLNAKVYFYMAKTNQAAITQTLITGDAEDIKLHNTIINEWRKTTAPKTDTP
ncbi:MAG: hypothetical protein VX705_11115 [Verrucomicrobiota bacterium]|nr:hypothetical protein [Verrucomicrobiota bacterium]